MEQRIKKYESYYKIFMVLGLLGILDVLTRGATKQSFGVDMGALSFAVLFGANFLFGSKAAAILSVFVEVALGFSLIWLLVAWMLKNKIKRLTKAMTEPKN